MADPNKIMAWGVLGVGIYLTGYALNAMRTGETQGYYRDHRHSNGEAGSQFGLWVSFRLILGLGCLALGFVFL